ncbi:MAG: hypothetical protein K8T20_15970 [Planctomycetes bacterium]|nr:hypothetical protein [Planctomycetota bacterium]
MYCSRETCKAGRRSNYMKKYMSGWKRKHPNYWRTERQKEYMKQWRDAHPAYFKGWRDKAKRRGKGK